jgi:LAGLIDADG endonuclease
MRQSQKIQKVSSETKREDITSAQKWATGLIDGHGHIGIEWSNSTRTKWVPLLKVSLHGYNARALSKLKKALKCGRITTSQSMITLRVTRIDHWQDQLLPLWTRFPLRGCKHHDVGCVRRALALRQNPDLSKDDKLKAVTALKCQL